MTQQILYKVCGGQCPVGSIIHIGKLHHLQQGAPTVVNLRTTSLLLSQTNGDRYTNTLLKKHIFYFSLEFYKTIGDADLCEDTNLVNKFTIIKTE